jgi:hypothetical protein
MVQCQYHFRSIGTGEGKSIVISAVGIMCALLGLEPEVACFSKILAGRDWNNARPWHEFFAVRIKYGTIDELIEVGKEYQVRGGRYRRCSIHARLWVFTCPHMP